jgi:hypothetical protein
VRTSQLGSIGAMREAADELDEIVAVAMERRWEEPRRVNPAPGYGWRCASYQAGKSLSSRETTSRASCIDRGNPWPEKDFRFSACEHGFCAGKLANPSPFS